MKVTDLKPQLRTTDLERSIRFYTEALGFELAFRFKDFYAGIRAGNRQFHLKLVDEPDPSVRFVRDGEHVHLFFEVEGVAAAAASSRRRASGCAAACTRPTGAGARSSSRTTRATRWSSTRTSR